MLEAFEAELGQPIGLRQCGYLFLLTRKQDIAAFEANVTLQRSLGVDTAWLTAQEVRERLPLLQTDDVLAGTFYPRDGLTDPNSVVAGYVSGARRHGAVLLNDVQVTGVTVSGQPRVARRDAQLKRHMLQQLVLG